MFYSLLPVIFVGVRIAAAQLLLPHQARALDGCYPSTENSTGGPLTVIKTGETPNGFKAAARGWNSWGIQATPNTTPSYPMDIAPLVNQSFIVEQCTILADPDILAAGYDLCSIDGGWYTEITDEYGRILYNTTLFPDLPGLGDYLHSLGLKLGVYAKPGTPCEAANKTIYGTNVTVGSTFNDIVDTNGNCYFDYSNPNTQLYHDSIIDLWASWGVDMIKLDYVTPGSLTGGSGMPDNTSGSAIAYHRAIINSGRQIRLDISSNVCRNEPYLDIWTANADSIRVSKDINAYGSNVFVNMWRVQETIENYRQYINQLVAANKTMTLHPNFDTVFVGNPANVTGVTDSQRISLMSYWIGSSSNLLLGSDLTSFDDLGRRLVTSKPSIAAADFCSNYPMQPRNPGTGSNQPMQLQAWIAGPDDNGEAYVLLSNLGTNLGLGGYVTIGNGTQNVSVTLENLGLTGSTKYTSTDVWFGNVTGVDSTGNLSALLGEGESQFLRLRPSCK